MSKLEDEIVLDPADPIENVKYIKSSFLNCELDCLGPDKVSLPAHRSLPAPPRHGVLHPEHRLQRGRDLRLVQEVQEGLSQWEAWQGSVKVHTHCSFVF